MNSANDLITVGSLFVELVPSAPGFTLATAHHYTLVAGGAAANFVFALARLGVKVSFITAVGEDDFGQLSINEMSSFGVDTSSMRRIHGQLTPVSFCACDRHGGKKFYFYRFPGYCSPMESLGEADFRNVADHRLFDFSEGSIREASLRSLVFRAAKQARAAGRQVCFAANLRKEAWMMPDEEIKTIQREAVSYADIIVLNEEETIFITGKSGEEGAQALQELGPGIVVMTRGGEGDALVFAGKRMASVAPFKVQVKHDVGAGDTFHAGLMATALRHENILEMTISDWNDAVQFASAVAAIRVSSSADPHDLPTYEHAMDWLIKKLRETPPHPSKH